MTERLPLLLDEEEISRKMPESGGYRYIGRNVRRNDIVEKVSGRLRYLADRPGGTAHARLILSTVANGKVLSMDLSEARKVPGVLRIYTPEDDPGKPFNSALSFRDQPELRDERIFTDRPFHVGDAIGAVLAETEEAARRAVALVKVAYDVREPVLDPLVALETPSLRDALSPCHRRNHRLWRRRALEEDTLSLETTVRTPRIHHAAMENHLCHAYREYGDVLVVESPCQMVFSVRFVLADLFDLPLNKVRVLKAPLGGAFGGKQEVLLEPACALMALDTGRPVRLCLDRRETIIATRVRAATIGRVRTVADKEGRFLFREIDVLTDAGAYLTGGHRVTMAMGKKTSRLYRIPSQFFREERPSLTRRRAAPAAATAPPRSTPSREIHIDLLARKLRMDPAELRMKNLVHPGDLDPTGAPPLGNARIRECLALGMERFRWEGALRRLSRNGALPQRRRLACCTHGNGYYGTPYPDFMAMALRLCEDGSVLVNAALHELGNGTLTVIAQIVAEVLDVPPEKVLVTEGDTQTSPFDAGCVASRVTYVCGACAQELAEKVRRRFLGQIARVTGASIETIRLANGQVFVGEEAPRSYGDMVLCITKQLREEVGDYLHYKPESNPASYGVHFAEIEADVLTGLVRVTDFLAVHDVGKALNPRFLEGQIYGGVQMGIGMALTEELLYDAAGRPKSDSFSRYHIVNARTCLPWRSFSWRTTSREAPSAPRASARSAPSPPRRRWGNAVNRALGTELVHLPLTPERILAALDRLPKGV
jgi:xanthine dehydrogenase molybdenum-binding subunit